MCKLNTHTHPQHTTNIHTYIHTFNNNNNGYNMPTNFFYYFFFRKKNKIIFSMKYINLRKKKIESEKKERKKNVTLHIKHKHTNHTTQTHKKKIQLNFICPFPFRLSMCLYTFQINFYYYNCFICS